MFVLYSNTSIINIAFWQVNVKDNLYDNKTDYTSLSIRKYILSLQKQKVIFGLHPSYGTSNTKQEINLQNKIFTKHFNSLPKYYRFHYLKYSYPEDLINIEREKLTIDISYCFVDSLLFRGGRTIGIKPWSFIEDRPINIVSIPISIMDGTLNTYLNFSYSEAKESVIRKILLTKKYGNILVLLWHNNNMHKDFLKNNYFPELMKDVKEIINKI